MTRDLFLRGSDPPKGFHFLGKSCKVGHEKPSLFGYPERQAHVTDPTSMPLKGRCPSRARTSPIFDLYWRFAATRQELFFARLEGQTKPWTTDPILSANRFTNAYRASDRVSQFLIRNVIYAPDSSTPEDTVFRVLLFKFFNRISTWQTLEKTLGPLTWETFNAARADEALSAELAAGKSVYSAAYMIPPVALERSGVKHKGHLWLIEHIMTGGFTSKLQDTPNLGAVFQLLKGYPSLGDFLAFQLTVDLAYTPLVSHTESQFVVAGPGARDGLSKVFPDARLYKPADLIAVMVDRQEQEMDRLGLTFRNLFGRPLQPIDCQNLFCEISKYTRVSNPEVVGASGRTRIKQRYRPADALPLAAPWYPPKWGLNGHISDYRRPPSSE